MPRWPLLFPDNSAPCTVPYSYSSTLRHIGDHHDPVINIMVALFLPVEIIEQIVNWLEYVSDINAFARTHRTLPSRESHVVPTQRATWGQLRIGLGDNARVSRDSAAILGVWRLGRRV